MSNAIDDKELDDYLSGDTQYSRRYRAIDADSVPADIDALILANAGADNVTSIATAIETRAIKGQRKRPLGFWMRASIPITLAASLVIALSIQLDNGVRLNTASQESAAVQSPPAMPAARDPIEQSRVLVQESFEMQDLANEKAKSSVESEQRKKEVQLAKRVAAEPTATSANQAVSESDKLTERQRADSTPPIDQRAQDAVNGSRGSLSPAVAAAAPISEATAKTDSMATPAISQETRVSNAKRAADAIALETVVVTAQRREGTGAGAGPRGTIPPGSFSEREPSAEELAKQYREANPGSWLGYIRDLRANGKARDADREWRQFVKAYPNYSVDEADSARPKK